MIKNCPKDVNKLKLNSLKHCFECTSSSPWGRRSLWRLQRSFILG